MNPDDVPYRPWAKALFDARKNGAHSTEDPDAHCSATGRPQDRRPSGLDESQTVRQEVHLRPDREPLEFICGENNRDIERLPGGHTVVSNVEAAAALGIPLR